MLSEKATIFCRQKAIGRRQKAESVTGVDHKTVQGMHAMRPQACWEEAQEMYRKHLCVAGLKKDERRGCDQQKVLEILEQGGTLSKAVLLACRIRYFSAGVASRSHEFVNRVCQV